MEMSQIQKTNLFSVMPSICNFTASTFLQKYMVAEETVFQNYQQNPLLIFLFFYNILSFVTNFSFSLNITLTKHIHTLILNAAIMNYIFYLSYSQK